MLTLDPTLIIALFLVTIFTLMVGVLDDLRSREVNTYLFVPLFIFALVIYAAYGASPLFIGLSSGLFLLTFFKVKTVYYATGGVIILACALAFGSADYYLYFIILFLMFILGAGEKYYGIGDVKAFISISFAFVFPVSQPFTVSEYPLLSFVPFNFIFLINTAIFSILFIPYLILLNYRRTGTIKRHHFYALDFDKEIYERHPERYRIAESKGQKIMIYGMPTFLPIYLAFLITFIFGLWFLYL